jgi:hypothetical protein
MSEFTTWEEMSTLEQMASQYWDMYKDAHGIRPRGIDTSSWTEADFNKEFEELNLISELNCRQRREDEQVAARKFESRVKELMEIGAKDREMAMRWIHEAEGSNGDDEFLCYLVGLPYRYFAKVD